MRCDSSQPSSRRKEFVAWHHHLHIPWNWANFTCSCQSLTYFICPYVFDLKWWKFFSFSFVNLFQLGQYTKTNRLKDHSVTALPTEITELFSYIWTELKVFIKAIVNRGKVNQRNVWKKTHGHMEIDWMQESKLAQFDDFNSTKFVQVSA